MTFRPLGAVKVGGLGGQHLQFVGGDRQGEAFAAITGGGGTCDPFQLDHLGTAAQLLGDEVASQLATGHVVGGDVGLDVTLGCAAVQGQHRDVRLVGQANGVAHGFGVGRVDQDGVDLAHGEIFHVGELLGRVVLGVQHHQLVAKLLGLGFGPSFMVTKKGLLRVETTIARV
jgi:hypothetical protein